MPALSLAPTVQCCEEPGSILLITFLFSFGRLLLDSPQSHLFFGLKNPNLIVIIYYYNNITALCLVKEGCA